MRGVARDKRSLLEVRPMSGGGKTRAALEAAVKAAQGYVFDTRLALDKALAELAKLREPERAAEHEWVKREWWLACRVCGIVRPPWSERVSAHPEQPAAAPAETVTVCGCPVHGPCHDGDPMTPAQPAAAQAEPKYCGGCGHFNHGRRDCEYRPCGCACLGPPEHPALAALRVCVEALAAAKDALIWCSGSSDFNPEGRAGEGWKRLGLPTLTTIDAALEQAARVLKP